METFTSMTKRRPACELERIPAVGMICPKCGIFVKFHVKQTRKLECMARSPSGPETPRKAIFA